jgi:hypothetical protein
MKAKSKVTTYPLIHLYPLKETESPVYQKIQNILKKIHQAEIAYRNGKGSVK